MKMTFYDLVDKDGNRYSNYGWRVRMALLHKGLNPNVELCFHSDPKLRFTNQNLVPVLVHGDNIVSDSWNIACYLDDAFPDRPALMQGPEARSVARFVNHWTDMSLDRVLVRSLYLDIFNSLHPDADAKRFRHIREERLKSTLEDLKSKRNDDFLEFNKVLAPLNVLLTNQHFVAGQAPAYVDYIVFGTFQLPYFLNNVDPLANENDAVRSWLLRMREHFDALSARHGEP
jgi:glutathione S-transferase